MKIKFRQLPSDYNSSEKWDVDTIRTKKGFRCRAFRNNIMECETKNHPTLQLARDALEDAVEKLPQAKRPSLDSLIWNPLQERMWEDEKWEGPKGYSPMGSQYGGSSFLSGPYTHCDHFGDKPVFRIPNSLGVEGCVVSGATKGCLKPVVGGVRRLVVNFSGSELSTSVSPQSVFRKIPNPLDSWLCNKDLKAYIPSPPNFGDELLINWSDGGAPQLTRLFWTDLLHFIATSPYTELVFCCVGGHGRTGTALAALALVGGTFAEKKVTFKGEPKKSATLAEKAETYIQHLYCKSAVETDAQVTYLSGLEKEL